MQEGFKQMNIEDSLVAIEAILYTIKNTSQNNQLTSNEQSELEQIHDVISRIANRF